jgi:pyruvate dehydrogenase E2 component (dihydrolipoamide acetyltransferase)
MRPYMDIRLPHLGEGADSGVVVNILVKVGDTVQKDQPILELETEKAVGTIPASAAGKVEAIRVKLGDKISAGQVIMSVGGGGGEGKGELARSETAKTEVREPKTEERPALDIAAHGSGVSSDSASAATPATAIPGVPPPAAPTVRKVARELGIDLSRVRGTEYGGRITMADVRAYIQQLQQAAAAPRREEKAAPVVEKIDFSQWGPVLKKPLSSLRQTISRRMAEAWTAIPHVTQFDEADITALNEFRKKYAKAYEAKGARLTLTGFAIKAVTQTLTKHPIFNASLDEAAGELVLKEYCHVGIAVDTEHGLIVPVIRNADKKSVLELSKELEVLAVKTRDRKVSADELRGGSFTISNQGGIGGGAFTPIVNKPQVAILGMGRGALKPVVVAGKVEVRLMLPMGLSYDHRVIDGGAAARFIVDLRAAFENFKESDVAI